MRQLHALVVEDEHDLADSFATLLRREGLRAEIIPDGKKALNILEETSPDIVLLDMNLPYVSGDKVLSYIRSAEHLRHCKVMIASANAHIATELSDSAELVLIKPVSLADLISLLRRLIMMLNTGEER